MPSKSTTRVFNLVDHPISSPRRHDKPISYPSIPASRLHAQENYISRYCPALLAINIDIINNLEKTLRSQSRTTSQSVSAENLAGNISSQPEEVGRRKFLKFEKEMSSQT